LEAESASHVPEELEAEAARAPVPPTGEWAQPSTVVEAPRAEELAPPTKEFTAFEEPPGVFEAQTAPTEPKTVAAPSAAVVEVESVTPVVSAPETREVVAPATDSAGDAGRAGDLRGRVARVREETRARVGRMREEAIVVLEEKPDDSGLRFVLVAAALFVLFLVLLFLSTTILR
jgi:hypothetical protein